MQKITPFLWFDAQAEEAVAFYLSVFKDGKIHTTTRYPEDGPRPAGTVMTIAFELQSQEEIDHYWEKLAADGGEPIQCGWVKEKFGMPWQIVPSKVWDWLRGEDPARVQRVTAALWQMEKLDLAELERAAGDG